MSSKDERISLVERAVKRMQEDGATGPAADNGAAKKVEAKKAAPKAPPRKTQAQADQAKREEEKRVSQAAAPQTPVAPKAPQAQPAPPPIQPASVTPTPVAETAAPPAQEQAIMRIDTAALRKRGMVTPTSGRTILVEEMRAIKRPILRRAFKSDRLNGSDALNNVVMISSCRSGEGKTFSAINLAMSIAMERDLYVMLIDTDVYRRGVSSLLGIKHEQPGLVDLVLDQELAIPDVLLRTNIDNLSVLPAGTQHPHATELLASQRMVDIIKDISSRYPDRMVIIDTPPVLASSEPRVLAAYVGQIALVVEEGETSRPLIENALDALGDSDKVRFILNKHRGRTKTDSYYGYTREAYS